jgi:hypothetical protein
MDIRTHSREHERKHAHTSDDLLGIFMLLGAETLKNGKRQEDAV